MTATIGEHTVSRASVTLAAYGLPWISIDLTEEVALSGAQTLVIGGQSIACSVVSGGASHGRSAYHLVGGAGGWGKVPPKKGYLDDAGVKVARVLQDLATDCGETLGTIDQTVRRGPHYARPDEAGFVILHELAPKNWYVDFAGVTRIGQRPTQTYTGDAPRTRIDKAVRVVELAVDEIDPVLVPGVVIDGNPPACDVEYVLDGSRLTVRAYYGVGSSDRMLDALSQMIDALYPTLRYAGTFEFRVVSQTAERLNLQPVRAQTGLPDLARVPVRPGVSGWRSDALPGELVLVSFVDRDPTRPAVTNHDSADAPGWIPTLCEFGDTTDFLATKTALDAVQAKLDDLIGKYNTATYPTGVGPSGTTTQPATTVGAQPHTLQLKAKAGT